ncbi:MAG: UpxY family transcription antiterminator [Nitrospiraceae bacterium]
MSEFNGRARWYALRTRSRHEKLVRDRLGAQGTEELLPTVKRLSKWKDRKKEIETPLFSGYCFARFAWQDRLSVLKVPGVVGIVGGGGCPEPIPDTEIDALNALVASTLRYGAHLYLHEGSKVEVVRGPLTGVTGILLSKGAYHRLVISVHLIQRAVAIEIDMADVVPA